MISNTYFKLYQSLIKIKISLTKNQSKKLLKIHLHNFYSISIKTVWSIIKYAFNYSQPILIQTLFYHSKTTTIATTIIKLKLLSFKLSS